MKLQFKYQKFQADAAKAVVDVFLGQPYLTPSYMIDKGRGERRISAEEERDYTGWPNAGIVPELSDDLVLRRINEIQAENRIEPSKSLEGRFNLTIEMETGVGKTYTYIKTMFELNKHYGWSKFIIVVPSIAVREGVYKAFETTREHFEEEYGKTVVPFIYDSGNLADINDFAFGSSIYAMIINSQAFNARGRDARRIYMNLDEFRGRRPIDVIAWTNPIVIIDEPQSVEGKQTKENLKRFQPLMTLRYSATHKADSIYNMVYRLDGAEAYNKSLVKKIAVKGITETGISGTNSYVYAEGIHLSEKVPAAILQFKVKSAGGIRIRSHKAGIGFDLYKHSGELEEYRDGFVVKAIDGCGGSVEFLNGIRIFAGDVIGKVSREQLRRIQIRETILSHIERERLLFQRGIKVLSLFFIDEVAHYREYDDAGQGHNGMFARMFEEEYEDITEHMEWEAGDWDYRRYLETIPASCTHAGYFSMDKRGRIVNRISGDDKKNRASNDIDAYDLIMKNKELLLERDPKISPVRFIFSHSALREGWDNPNVFQICTLKQSGSEVRKRQEVGRGLRLCVNQNGERMDEGALGEDVHDVNVLTVIASESYDSFAKGLQTELAQDLGGRSREIIPENARGNNVTPTLSYEKLNSREFQKLWERISRKSAYGVDFDTEELISGCVNALDDKLSVSCASFRVETGKLGNIKSKTELMAGEAMEKKDSFLYERRTAAAAGVSLKYDLVGEVANGTGLTRRDIISIFTKIREKTFRCFRENPEEFILKASGFINEQKALAITKHIKYQALDERYGTDIFPTFMSGGRLGVNAMKVSKHLYDHLIYDSINEREFAKKLEMDRNVAVYVKLPRCFRISTPVGGYTPEWAVAFYDGSVKCAYFAAETKGSEELLQHYPVEAAKIHCAREHFNAVGKGEYIYDVVDGYEDFEQKIRK